MCIKTAPIDQNRPKLRVLCAKKGHQIEKSTPTPVVAVVTDMGYADFLQQAMGCLGDKDSA